MKKVRIVSRDLRETVTLAAGASIGLSYLPFGPHPALARLPATLRRVMCRILDLSRLVDRDSRGRSGPSFERRAKGCVWGFFVVVAPAPPFPKGLYFDPNDGLTIEVLE